MSSLLPKIDRLHTADVTDLAAPAWARELAGNRFQVVSERVDNTPDLTPAAFEDQTFQAYQRIAESITASDCALPVRFWNHVPFITDPADTERDNYMVFNAGRFRAFNKWYGGTAQFDQHMATASAIGHWGRDLVIHCLATDTPAVALNNPRQVAPYHYSQRFGPLPPCFSRATQLARPAGMLLVGGTASVRGEDSVHADDLPSQFQETTFNLAALVASAHGHKRPTAAQSSRWLAAFCELRVYFPQRRHQAEIESSVRREFRSLKRLEMLHADLCRADLLVEIEGVADLTVLS